MATVIQSNKAYTGSKVLPNIIDGITTTTDKTSYLKKLYASVLGDSAYITSANADSLFSTLKTHRDRVIADGGIVLSLAQTLRAIIFALKNSLTTANYSAVSPEFGVKLSGINVTKVYDLAGRDQEVLTGSITRTIDGNLNVISAAAPASLISKAASLTGGVGIIIGSSSHDINSDTTSLVRSPTILQNAAGTGTSFINIENNNGNVARLTYTVASGSTTTASYSQVGAGYLKYAGIVAITNATNMFFYENGVQKSTATTTPKDYTGIALYPASTISSANSFLNESWVINSTSTALAQALGIHLNKSIFN